VRTVSVSKTMDNSFLESDLRVPPRRPRPALDRRSAVARSFQLRQLPAPRLETCVARRADDASPAVAAFVAIAREAIGAVASGPL
jgi:hypothetical protein